MSELIRVPVWRRLSWAAVPASGTLLLAALLTLVLALAGATSARASEPSVPQLKGRINDRTGVLIPSEAARLDSMLEQYQSDTGHTFVLLIIPSLDGESIEAFSLRTAESWALGTADRDDGLLMVVALDDRKIRIEVGYGLEGAVPDGLAGDIIGRVMAPRFREGDIAGGIREGFRKLMKAAEGEAVGLPPLASRRQGVYPLVIYFLVLGLGSALFCRFPAAAAFPLAMGLSVLLARYLIGEDLHVHALVNGAAVLGLASRLRDSVGTNDGTTLEVQPVDIGLLMSVGAATASMFLPAAKTVMTLVLAVLLGLMIWIESKKQRAPLGTQVLLFLVNAALAAAMVWFFLKSQYGHANPWSWLYGPGVYGFLHIQGGRSGSSWSSGGGGFSGGGFSGGLSGGGSFGGGGASGGW